MDHSIIDGHYAARSTSSLMFVLWIPGNQAISIAVPWCFLSRRQHCGGMSDVINVSARRFVLAGTVGVLLVGAVLAYGQWSAQVVPATLGFATAIMIIAAAFVGWERQVDAAESDGLVKHYGRHPAQR